MDEQMYFQFDVKNADDSSESSNLDYKQNYMKCKELIEDIV